LSDAVSSRLLPFFERDRIIASVPMAQIQGQFIPIGVRYSPQEFDLAWSERRRDGVVVENYVSQYGQRYYARYVDGRWRSSSWSLNLDGYMDLIYTVGVTSLLVLVNVCLDLVEHY
jgi:hypothetical protein